jgi:sterol desaturase/sphingolipid hydroxylase (fatty acid hydroxylase superfamily)
LSPVTSPAFAGLVTAAVGAPYVLCCLIYWYHFSGRKSQPRLRKEGDQPEDAYLHDWKSALLKPEGISAPVVYMILGLTLSLAFPEKLGWLVPPSIKDLSVSFNPLVCILHFLVFDSLMWVIHFTQHRWRWLYYNTHAVHHTISSPTMIVALTGYLPDTCLLILLPLHTTFLLLASLGNLMTVGTFAVGALLHLHMIHSEFEHSWDPFLRKIGIANTWDHHIHHCVPRHNLAHFFVFLDKMFGTYTDPLNHPKLVIDKKKAL